MSGEQPPHPSPHIADHTPSTPEATRGPQRLSLGRLGTNAQLGTGLGGDSRFRGAWAPQGASGWGWVRGVCGALQGAGEKPDATSEFNQHSRSTQDRLHTHTHTHTHTHLDPRVHDDTNHPPPMPVRVESGHPSENWWMKRMKPSLPPVSLGKWEGKPPSGKRQAKKWRGAAGTRLCAATREPRASG